MKKKKYKKINDLSKIFTIIDKINFIDDNEADVYVSTYITIDEKDIKELINPLLNNIN